MCTCSSCLDRLDRETCPKTGTYIISMSSVDVTRFSAVSFPWIHICRILRLESRHPCRQRIQVVRIRPNTATKKKKKMEMEWVRGTTAVHSDLTASRTRIIVLRAQFISIDWYLFKLQTRNGCNELMFNSIMYLLLGAARIWSTYLPSSRSIQYLLSILSANRSEILSQ